MWNYTLKPTYSDEKILRELLDGSKGKPQILLKRTR